MFPDLHAIQCLDDCIDSLDIATIRKDQNTSTFTPQLVLSFFPPTFSESRNEAGTFLRATDVLLKKLKWQMAFVLSNIIVIFLQVLYQHVKLFDTLDDINQYESDA